jgi:amino acid adenylation domain-containing protein
LLIGSLALLISRYRGSEFVVITCTESGATNSPGVGTARRLRINDQLSGGAFLADLTRQLAGESDGVDCALPDESAEFEVDWQVALQLVSEVAEFHRVGGLSPDPRFSLAVLACPDGDSVLIRFFVRDDVMESWMGEAISRHFERLWTQLSGGDSGCICDLAILTDEEFQQIVLDWNDTGVEEPVGTPIPDLFEENMAEFGEAVAAVDGKRTICYRELRSRANQLGHFLRRLGAGLDVPVAVFLERSIELVVGIAGLQRAGAAYMPLDPSYPSERIRYQVEDSGVPIIVTNARLAEKLPRENVRVVLIDEEAEAIAAESDEALAPGFSVGNVSNVFYTSGSTGKPKGVLMRHSRLTQTQSAGKKKTRRMSPGQGMLLKSPVGFTLILLEVNSAISSGGRLIVVPDGKEKDPAYLVRAIVDHSVGTAGFVPSMLDLLLDEPGVEECRSLKTINTVGESLPVEVQERCLRKLPDTKLIVYYGCTEAPAATSRVIKAEDDFGRRIVIGKPCPGKRVYILDKNGVPLPIGVAGEIYIGGSLSKGYLNRDELTSERFQDDPFSPFPGARVYRTGDLARWLPDGNLEILGRTDFQVQVRGVRIELGEIEDVLRSHDAVRDAIVHPDQKGGQVRLFAYVTPSKGGPVPIAELRERVRDRLPEYMMPATIIEMEFFPLNAAGKVDRLALPKPEKVERSAETVYLGPETPTELRLCEIWTELLGIDRVGIEDDFLDLGGDSFLAVKLLRDIRVEFGRQLEMPDLFENPCVRKLAEVLDGIRDQSELRWLIRVNYDQSQPPTHKFEGSFVFAYAYTQIMERLQLRFPVYSISIDWKYANLDYSEGVVELARHHVEELMRNDPNGPYRFAGYSFGGLVAYEMACQVRALGHPVEFMVLLDSTPPFGTKGAVFENDGEPKTGDRSGQAAPRAKKTSWERFLETPLSEKPAWVWERRKGVNQFLVKKSSKLVRALVVRGLWPSSKVPEDLRREWATLYKNAIWRRYKPGIFDGDVVVFGTEQNVKATRSSWSAIVKGRLDFRILPVYDHSDVLSDPVALKQITSGIDELLNSHPKEAVARKGG